MGAVSLTQAKDALPGYSGTTDDAKLTRALTASEAQVAKFCGWPHADTGVRSFLSATFTLYGRRDPADHRRLLLPVRPSAITSVHVDSAETYGSGSLLGATQYEIDNSAGFGLYALNGQTWGTGTRTNKVVCTAGWAEGSAPDDVVEAVIAQLRHHWKILRVGQGRPQVTQQGNSQARDSLVAIPAIVAQMARMSEAFSGRTA